MYAVKNFYYLGDYMENSKKNSLRIAGVIKESIVDGPGIRYTIFTQGCPHHCEGCHNPETHSFEGGRLVLIDDIVKEIKQNPLLDGVTLSGGEPFEQAEALSLLAKIIHDLGLNVFCYTGYTYEFITNKALTNQPWKELLNEIDVLIDGKFDIDQKSLLLNFRGSKNQKIIDVKKSINSSTVVTLDW